MHQKGSGRWHHKSSTQVCQRTRNLQQLGGCSYLNGGADTVACLQAAKNRAEQLRSPRCHLPTLPVVVAAVFKPAAAATNVLSR
mmetsp:Transcript_61733/g.127978  ORF Transcript_61733/g.127978 Transcript_61733/m.127978 type:complete len:84 (-) Transcript_61733:215-466(-)